MPTEGIARKIMFVAWADASEDDPFEFDAAAGDLASIAPEQRVYAHGELLTAVDHVRANPSDGALRLQLLALHDGDNAPSEWSPEAGATSIEFDDGHYAAFVTHVVIWPDKIAAFDRHKNAPGLGRLAAYIKKYTGERVIFRALYEQGLKQELEELNGYRAVEYSIHDPHKKTALASSGMIGSLLPRAWQQIPSLRVRVGMGRKGRRDAYLPDEVHDEVVEMSDAAEELFDSLVISGLSKTLKTPTGKPKTVKVNLLSQRLHVATELPRDSDRPGLPALSETFKAIRAARRQLDSDGKLEDAVEARLVLEP